MSLRTWLGWLASFALLLGCGGSDKPSMTEPKDSGSEDSGPMKVKDAGKPVVRDAGHAADSGKDSGTPDAGFDAGPPPPPPDSGPGDVGIDAGPAPTAWKCAAALWADGYCDCGCGVADFDCTGQNCTGRGCTLASCDACYTEGYAWKSCTPAANLVWTCSMAEQVDMTCDCGCGAPDDACGGSGCSEPGCWRAKCGLRHDATGAVLNDMFPPFNGWTCPAAAWGGGDGCDCGCGVADPDCSAGLSCTAPLCNAGECKTCHDATGRVVLCDDQLKTNWTCAPQSYGSGDGCDCGCGAPDPDCDGKGCSDYNCRDMACKRCTDSDYANDKLVGCTPLSGWSCDKSHYGTGDGCDCGCGVHDPDCGDAANGCSDSSCQQDKCEYCHTGQSADPRSDNDYIICDPPGDAKGWTCGTESDPAWKNAECDCGCGRPDPYCRIKNQRSCTAAGCKTATCDFCNAENGARAACDGPKWTVSGTCKASLYGLDGVCDCGCGALDPDCADGEGCAASLCAAKGCEVCHGPGTLLAKCLNWTCPKAAYGDGTVCDCGCGAPDPDCSGFGCSEPGCRGEMCSPNGCHDQFGRVVRCP
jgi:hypothetical protein